MIIQEIKEQIKEDKAPEFSVDKQETLWYKKRLCVPEVKEIRELILRKAHDSAYSIHPGVPRCAMISRVDIGGME
jgi:hypothetical protein